MNLLIANLFTALAIASTRDNVAPAIPEWLNMLSALLVRDEVAAAELHQLKVQIELMVEQDREPTTEEWSALLQRSNDAHDRIQNADLSEAPGFLDDDDDG